MIARHAQGNSSSFDQLSLISSGGPGQSERPRVMVRKQLSPVGQPTGDQLLDPACGPAVPLGPGEPRQLAIDEVTNDYMAELHLNFSRHA